MKRVIAIMALCVTLALLVYLQREKHSLDGFNCSALMVLKASKTQGVYDLAVDVRMFFTNDHEGFYMLNGTYSAEGKSYDIQRVRYFTYTLKNRQQLYDLVITKESISTYDNTPKPLAARILLPIGSSMLPLFKRIDNHSILVSLLYSPYFICSKS